MTIDGAEGGIAAPSQARACPRALQIDPAPETPPLAGRRLRPFSCFIASPHGVPEILEIVEQTGSFWRKIFP
jgi:hypothetical protein